MQFQKSVELLGPRPPYAEFLLDVRGLGVRVKFSAETGQVSEKIGHFRG